MHKKTSAWDAYFFIGYLTNLILLIEYAKRKENQTISKGSIIPKYPLIIYLFIYLLFFLIQIFELHMLALELNSSAEDCFSCYELLN
jgi:hypothetical protein